MQPDGERVTKFVEIRVRKVAETVAKSLLVKCSFNDSDPNNLMSSFLSDKVGRKRKA